MPINIDELINFINFHLFDILGLLTPITIALFGYKITNMQENNNKIRFEIEGLRYEFNEILEPLDLLLHEKMREDKLFLQDDEKEISDYKTIKSLLLGKKWLLSEEIFSEEKDLKMYKDDVPHREFNKAMPVFNKSYEISSEFITKFRNYYEKKKKRYQMLTRQTI